MGDRYYLILGGRVRVLEHGIAVNSLGEGSGFGEIALLHGVKSTASVVAGTDVRLLAIRREAFLIALDGAGGARLAAIRVAETHLQHSREARARAH